MLSLTKQQVYDIIEWDVLNWAQLIDLWQPVIDNLPKCAKILAIGERNGGLSAWLAMQGFQVICTDRTGTTYRAKALHQYYNVSHLVQYTELDIVQYDGQYDNCFDLVIAKSVIGGLKRIATDASTRDFSVQCEAVRNVHRYLKHGGIFLSAENMRSMGIANYWKKVCGKHSAWRYLHWQELPALFANFREVTVKEGGILPTSSSIEAFNEVVFWLNNRLLKILPASMHYIAFITACK